MKQSQTFQVVNKEIIVKTDNRNLALMKQCVLGGEKKSKSSLTALLLLPSTFSKESR